MLLNHLACHGAPPGHLPTLQPSSGHIKVQSDKKCRTHTEDEYRTSLEMARPAEPKATYMCSDQTSAVGKAQSCRRAAHPRQHRTILRHEADQAGVAKLLPEWVQGTACASSC